MKTYIEHHRNVLDYTFPGLRSVITCFWSIKTWGVGGEGVFHSITFYHQICEMSMLNMKNVFFTRWNNSITFIPITCSSSVSSFLSSFTWHYFRLIL